MKIIDCRYCYWLLFFIGSGITPGLLQAQHIDVYPGLTGAELLENLVETYKLAAFPDQADNRDTLFGAVDNRNDSLTCVYSGYSIYLDPNEDPTQDAFDKEINTEHTFPKSMGAEGFAEGDMHHLYPTRADVNNDRGNLPFGEVPDNEANSWYYQDIETSNTPSSNIDLYSERKDGLFEPPEAHKGNVARSMMYFYTMYKDVADAANPTFFETQRETFCAWHFLDPVDQNEWDRTWKIASYQEDKPNPFVLDCTLPERSYCEDFGQNCSPTMVNLTEVQAGFSFNSITPNPISEGATFYYSIKNAGPVTLEIYNLEGNLLEQIVMGRQAVGDHNFYWENKNGLAPGMLICQLTFGARHERTSISKKAFLLK